LKWQPHRPDNTEEGQKKSEDRSYQEQSFDFIKEGAVSQKARPSTHVGLSGEQV
jgi:hypothetical protein